MKYTKGPWKTAFCSQEVEKDGLFIATTLETSTGGFEYPDAETMHYNAQLIAAAPDLYEAAKALLACLDMSALSNDEVEGVNNLYNALAKAEGK